MGTGQRSLTSLSYASERSKDLDRHTLLVHEASKEVSGVFPTKRSLPSSTRSQTSTTSVEDLSSPSVLAPLWMLRGTEPRSTLGDQVVVASQPVSVTMHLAATKTDPTGTGAPRRLARTCGRCGGQSSQFKPELQTWRRPVLSRNGVGDVPSEKGLWPRKQGLVLHHPSGFVVTHEGLRITLQRIFNDERASEHSL